MTGRKKVLATLFVYVVAVLLIGSFISGGFDWIVTNTDEAMQSRVVACIAVTSLMAMTFQPPRA